MKIKVRLRARACLTQVTGRPGLMIKGRKP